MSSKAWFIAGAILIGICPGVAAPALTQDCKVDVPEWAPRGSARSARPVISATFLSTCAAPIEVSSIHMTVDDETVMPKTEATGNKVVVSYTPMSALQEEADHTVVIQAKDSKGAVVEKSWTFHLGDTYSR
jgi:hypothetical protein